MIPSKENIEDPLVENVTVQQESLKYPQYFHNSSKYDFHLVIKALSEYGNKKIEIIPSTEETYISFTYRCIQFMDSLRLNSVPKSMLSDVFREFFK